MVKEIFECSNCATIYENVEDCDNCDCQTTDYKYQCEVCDEIYDDEEEAEECCNG